MITWLQTRFQTGYKILFFVVLIVIIVAFVFTVGDVPGMGRAGPRAEIQEYYGYNLRSHLDQQEIGRLAGISFYANYGQEAGQQLSQYALERLAYLGTGRELGIPPPTDEELRQYIRTLPGFRGPDGRFDQQSYLEYIDFVEAHPQLTTGDLGRVFEEDYIVAKVRELLSGPGYAVPHEVRRQLARQKTEWTIEVATLPMEDLDVEVEFDEEDLRHFYEENDFRYEVAPRKFVSYVVFAIDDYLDEVDAPTEEEMREYFEANRGDFAPPEEVIEEPVENAGDEEPEESEPREVEFTDVEQEVALILKRRAARRVAEQAASDFTFALFEEEISMNSDELAEKIAEHNLRHESVQPFPEGERPADVNFSEEIVRAIQRLNENRYFSDPHRFEENFIVLFLEDIEPAFIPPFEDVRDRVAGDLRAEERRRMRAERGNELYETFTQRVEDGESFDEVAEELGLGVRLFEPFARENPPRDLDWTLLERLHDLRSGQVSRMVQSDNQAHFIHVLNREVPEIDETHEDFARTFERTRTLSANVSGHFAINEIMDRAMPRQTQPVR